MSQTTVPDTIPDNIMEMPGVSELSMEQMEQNLPCEANKHFWGACKSDGLEPATWMISHENGQPKCTVLLCEPCVSHLQQWLAECIVGHGAHGFGCRICNYGPFHYREFTMREL